MTCAVYTVKNGNLTMVQNALGFCGLPVYQVATACLVQVKLNYPPINLLKTFDLNKNLYAVKYQPAGNTV